MARPTKLTKELVEKASGYVNETKMGGMYHGDLPTVAGLSIYLDVAVKMYPCRCKLDSPLGREFSDIVERVGALSRNTSSSVKVSKASTTPLSPELLTEPSWLCREARD